MAIPPSTRFWFHLLRWCARIGSAVCIWILGAFLLGEFGDPTAKELVAIALFPVGVSIGMALGWWRELLGGVVGVGCLAAFYLLALALRGHVPGGPYFLLFSSPAFIFMAAGLVKRMIVPRAQNNGGAAGHGATSKDLR